MIIYGVVKERKTSVFVIGLCVAAVAIARGFMSLMSGSGGFVELIIGLLILFMSFYKSTSEVSEKGVDEIFNLFTFRKHSIWSWEDVSFIYADFRRQAPLVLVSFKFKQNTRKLRIERKDIQKVFNLAAEGHEGIKIVHNGEEEYENAMGEAEYMAERNGTEQGEVKPKTFHEVALYIKKQRREELLRKPDPKTVKVVSYKGNLKSFKTPEEK